MITGIQFWLSYNYWRIQIALNVCVFALNVVVNYFGFHNRDVRAKQNSCTAFRRAAQTTFATLHYMLNYVAHSREATWGDPFVIQDPWISTIHFCMEALDRRGCHYEDILQVCPI